MSSVVIIDNEQTWCDGLAGILKDRFQEKDHIVTTTNMTHLHHSFEDVGVVLVDLELGLGDKPGVKDYDGRDVVLPAIRRQARWVPVILMSRYITGEDALLAELTPFDFDAVVPKGFFTDRKVLPAEWGRLRRRASLRRVACLTGRAVESMEEALADRVAVDYGRKVAEELRKYDEEAVVETIKLLGFSTRRVVLDQVIQGFSGLSVVKLTCESDDSEPTQWLVKFGNRIAKLDREIAAHRRMFIDGVARSVSAAALHTAPVTWRSVGMIAYEFERDSKTLLEIAISSGVLSALDKVVSTLKTLFADSRYAQIVPRAYLAEICGQQVQRDALPELVMAARSGERFDLLDDSVRVRVGPQHGDLHGRNILVSGENIVLIDFAHYRGSRGSMPGVPLLDAAKLLVDLSVFVKELPWKLGQIAGDGVLDLPRVRDWLCRCGVFGPGQDAQPGEVALLQAGMTCYMAAYLTYADVDTERKAEIARALRPPRS